MMILRFYFGIFKTKDAIKLFELLFCGSEFCQAILKSSLVPRLIEYCPAIETKRVDLIYCGLCYLLRKGRHR